ncbi:hypothetical protein [Clostridium sp. UBA4395]|uniref:hypothetical protein n=1 Tax=Clostridium sp. UBA4395 TaxID=1946360 RepID=UPI003217AE85
MVYIEFIAKIFFEVPAAKILLVINIICIVGSLVAFPLIQKSSMLEKEKKLATILDTVFLILNMFALFALFAISIFFSTFIFDSVLK